MKLQFTAIVWVAVLLVCGCTAKNRYLEKRGMLDESLYYYEQDSKGNKYPISDDGTSFKERKPSRVPQPAQVDMDSMIHIDVSKGTLAPKNDEGFLLGRSEDLLKQKRAIHEALVELERVVQTRKEAVDAYYKSPETFQEAKKAFGKAEQDFIEKLMALWPDGTPEFNELEAAYDPPTFRKIQRFLQSRIDAVEAEDRVVEHALDKRTVSLRLEAVLQSPEKDPVAIHLDGYDSIKQGDFQRRDRLGLDLTDEERERLDAQIQWTRQIASTAERVRKGEISLQYALEESLSLISERLGRLVPEMRRILSKLDEDALKARLNQMEQDSREFIALFRTQAGGLTERTRRDLNAMPRAFRSYMEQESKGYAQVLFLMTEIEALKERWAHAGPSDQVTLITDTRRMLKRFSDMGKAFLPLSDDVVTGFKSFLEKSFQNMDTRAKDALLRLLESDEAARLRAHIQDFYGDLRSIRDLVNEAVGVFDIITVSPVAIETHAPETIRVPYDEIKDTFFDLNYTTRLRGDTVTIRATLFDEETEKDKTTALFQVERFGWYAELSPSVVLVKPDKLEGGNDGFRFAPTLSWMHHYRPRPEDASWSASVLRGLQPALGIHSAFTNFDSEGSDEAIQVGLGTTISFWDNRLQFGAGYNLMADSDQDGRYYFFVGTDLIGLLQTIGIGK